MKRFALLTIAALAMTAMMATTASAVVTPNGDTERDNWRHVFVRGYDTEYHDWMPCLPPNHSNDPITNPPEHCIKPSGPFTWRFRVGTDTQFHYQCTQASLNLNVANDGTTLIGAASWYNPNQAYDRCSIYEPKSYASTPSEQANLTGMICKHLPSGQFYINQGIVIGPRFPSSVNPTEYWKPTFMKLTGNPYYFSQTNTYPYGTGLQTARLSIGSSSAYQLMGGASGAGSTAWRQYAEFPLHNLLISPQAAAGSCNWPGLT